MPFDCIRKECIEDPDDAYHYESHKCFVCGEGFMPSVEVVNEEQCPECGWLTCPYCGCCKCDLKPEDQEWIDYVSKTYCQDRVRMAGINVSRLPDTVNRCVKEGLGMQLAFCKRWSAVRVGDCTDEH